MFIKYIYLQISKLEYARRLVDIINDVSQLLGSLIMSL